MHKIVITFLLRQNVWKNRKNWNSIVNIMTTLYKRIFLKSLLFYKIVMFSIDFLVSAFLLTAKCGELTAKYCWTQHRVLRTYNKKFGELTTERGELSTGRGELSTECGELTTEWENSPKRDWNSPQCEGNLPRAVKGELTAERCKTHRRVSGT